MYTKYEQTALFSRYIPLKTAILERGHGIIMTEKFSSCFESASLTYAYSSYNGCAFK